ncbi:efflux RND transporter periplasmic adaptor subunit [Salipiger mucosus]|uniref:Membrane-fusion protein n=1 Tax=Salipiger mucosus DSM 16094 TaxID=1123237 RepID=S9QWA5_9RHOB|nr:efflux RND transporter periplasmic adaptor subunit [Salipiger mucosus]EPX85636.1 Membrane-fusion protein [Salipiger mucosus DSM 16094]
MTSSDGQDAQTGQGGLRFESDRGASRSIWIASALLLAIVLWMGSGFVFPSEEETAEASQGVEVQPPAVRVRASTAEAVTLTFGAEGQALPERDTEVRAEASGTVVRLPARKGEPVEQGAVIAELSSQQAQATLEQAREEEARAQREFDNASQLLERGVATVDRVAQARATLAAAEAQVASAEQALEDLTVVAPFAGRIERLPINEGEYVASGDEVARIVDNDPLTVAIQVPQQALNRIRTGQAAQVRFITGQTREGTVTFVGTAAASETRTFLTEIEVANPEGDIPAGVSAEITIPTGQAEAHFVRPSVVSLNPEGEIGIKTVEGDRVRFHPVEIVKAEVSGVWATGLPENAQIITVGQGFVREGETVRARPAEDEDTGEAAEAPESGAAQATLPEDTETEAQP